MAPFRSVDVDLFISYNRADRDHVVRITDRLAASGLSLFLDSDHLVSGLPWPQALEEALNRAGAVAVFIGPHGLGEWQKREMYFALDRQVEARRDGRSFLVIPVLLPRADVSPGFLFLNSWADFRQDVDDPRAFRRLVDTIRAATPEPSSPPSVEVCPYRGLNAFREEDEALFFGRQVATDAVLHALQHRCVAIVAGSGFGKSSVMMAGVVPKLRRRRPPLTTWDVAVFAPRTNPWLGVAQSLVPLLEPELTEARKLAEATVLAGGLANDRDALGRVVDRIIQRSRGTDRLLLAIDQFEELLTQVPSHERLPFINAILAATATSPLTVVLTLRADYYGVALGLSRGLADALNRAQVSLGPLTTDECRAAIEGPANLTGLTFEAGLVDAILDDIGTEPGSLPLLEYALMALWQARDGHMLTHSAYAATGGVRGAISARAEQVFVRQNSSRQQATRRLFGRLVRVSEADEEGADTKRRAAREELGEESWAAAEDFAAAGARLLVIDASSSGTSATVEVAHEALIRRWKRLAEWLKEDRAFLLWRQRLDVFLRAWRSTGALLAPELVEESIPWMNERKAQLTDDERQYLDESRRAVHRARVPIRAALGGLILAALGAVVVWIAQATHVHMSIDLTAGDSVIIKSGLARLDFLPWPGNRRVADTGLRRRDIKDQAVLSVSHRDTDPRRGDILAREDVQAGLADTFDAALLKYATARSLTGRRGAMFRLLQVHIEETDYDAERLQEAVVARLLLENADDESYRQLGDIVTHGPSEQADRAIAALSRAVALDPSIAMPAVRVIALGLERSDLVAGSVAAALERTSRTGGVVAESCMAALAAALQEHPSDAAIANAIVGIGYRTSRLAELSDRLNLSEVLLRALEGAWADHEAAAEALARLIQANPALASRQTSDVPASIGSGKRSNLVGRVMRVASDHEDRFGRSGSAMSLLGTIAAVRDDLASEIESLFVAELQRYQAYAFGAQQGVEALARTNPVAARRMLPRLMSLLANADASVLSHSLLAIAAVISSNQPVPPDVIETLGDVWLRWRSTVVGPAATVALIRAIQKDTSSAAKLIAITLEVLSIDPGGMTAEDLADALVKLQGAAAARQFALPMARSRLHQDDPARVFFGRSSTTPLTTIVNAAHDTCGTIVGELRPKLDAPGEAGEGTRAAAALAEAAKGDRACADLILPILWDHAAAANGDLRATLVSLSADAMTDSSYRLRPEQWRLLTADVSSTVRHGAEQAVTNTLLMSARREKDPPQYLLDHLDGRVSLFQSIGVDSRTSAAYRDAVSTAVGHWVARSPDANQRRPELDTQLRTIARSDEVVYRRVAALKALATGIIVEDEQEGEQN